jgi:hypothetical protein
MFEDKGCLIVTLVIIAFFGYTFMNDNTRVTHPDYKNSWTYKACIESAQETYNRTLEEAFNDPSEWQLGGYESPYDYAKSMRALIIHRCNS